MILIKWSKRFHSISKLEFGEVSIAVTVLSLTVSASFLLNLPLEMMINDT